MAEDLKRVHYQLERALVVDAPAERLSRASDNKPDDWRLRDRLTDADITAIVAAWQAGLSQTGIAKRYGISQTSVSRLIAKYGRGGDSLRKPKLISERFSPEKLVEIVAAYRGGMKQREVVEHYGISASALKRLLKKSGA